MSELPFAADAPVSVGMIGLKVRDLERVTSFYRDAIGLTELSRRGNAVTLGAGDLPLLELEHVPGAKPDDPRSAGLFHAAFLLPSRKDLANWTRHAAERRIPVTGASDHLVSEAIYLNDPEGNGIEIYVDRPRSDWAFERNGTVKMATLPLDVQNLLGELEVADPVWPGAPAGTMVGHVHLRVGSAADAENWWREKLGFDTMATYGSAAVFLSTGGYHHHVGANAWQSAGAGMRPDRAGLSYVQLNSRLADEESLHIDPWGTSVRVVPSGA
ncbi:VOC family protein [Pseudaminobacter sp. 19-2017]|uniref:VOC family protein n=1 Tax=Pseudaminobacter soli (ex Zhang et al. 2022) TaxID=2831468 RepID=A0A942DYP4_9HYPH|nr:VOC family protein [Pseudaminobacter soli]MBS3647455.1 VOC family protein [Pseudaminobacter soli]